MAKQKRPQVVVFASGTRTGGGTGFEKLVEATKDGTLAADIAAVVSNWESGGVRTRAEKLNIPFEYLGPPYSCEKFSATLEKYQSDWAVLSGWMKLVPVKNKSKGIDGLDSKKTINIHPGPLPRFGGPGMYGMNVHKAVLEAFQRGEVTITGPTIHFVTEEYDKGPIIFHKTVAIDKSDSATTISEKVKKLEDYYYARVLQLVLNEEIVWDGVHADSLVVPENYDWLPRSGRAKSNSFQ